MPRELRTPKERLEAVSVLRDGRVQLLELIADVDGADLEFFEAALVDETRMLPPMAGSAGEQLVFVQSILRGMLGRLGGLVDDAGRGVHLLPFALPTTEKAEGVVTSVVAGAPGPQPRVFFSVAPAAAVAPAAPTNGTPADRTP
jgi:hypothetical protein